MFRSLVEEIEGMIYQVEKVFALKSGKVPIWSFSGWSQKESGDWLLQNKWGWNPRREETGRCWSRGSQGWSSNFFPDPICTIQWAPVWSGGHRVQELWGLRAGNCQGQWGACHHQVLHLSTFVSWLFLTRLMTIEGNMNPKMSEVDIVPDDDLNTRLKFYVSDKPDGNFTRDV